MMPLKNFLYIQHIDWNSLPQRPQYLACELEKKFYKFSFKIFFTSALKKNRLVSNSIKTVGTPDGIPGTPYWYYPFFRSLSTWQFHRSLKKYDLKDSIIYVTHPRVYAALKKRKVGFLIYDCMDDAVAMTPRFKSYVSKLESNLIRRADIIICSSEKLQQDINSKHNRNSLIIQNGINKSAFKTNERNLREQTKNKKTAIFFGVIGDWLDQEFMIDVNNQHGWELEIYGILETKLKNELVGSFKGLLNQSALYERVKDADVALLPYLENPFTETINPVKMYEYIALGIPVIAPPLSSLKEFKNLYVPKVNPMTTCELLVKSQEIYPENEEARRTLVEKSYWGSRAEQIEAVIENRLKPRYEEIPTISVVIPTMGSGTLNVAIQSVLEQSLPVNEIIVVLDSDIEIKLPADSRIVLLDKLQKQGANSARNLGISRATSDIVCLLDDDDSWEIDKVETQLKRVMSENPSGDWISWHKIRTYNFNSKKPVKMYSDPRKIYNPNENIFDYIFRRTKFLSGHGIIQSSTLMFPREFAANNPFDPDIKFHQDLLWALGFANKDLKWIYVDSALTKFYLSLDGISSKILPNESLALFQKTFPSIEKKYLRSYYLSIYFNLARKVGDLKAMRVAMKGSFESGFPQFMSLIVSITRYLVAFLKN